MYEARDMAVNPGLRKSKKPIRRLAFCLILLARPERFERPTPWFVAKYSIQLSYGRLAVFEREIIPSRLAALKHYLTIGSA